MDQSVTQTNRNSGFTLIELMIVVATIAILAAIAYPSYVRYEKKANASAAEQFMLTVANAEDQYLLDARFYALDNGTPGAAVGTLKLQEPKRVSDNYAIAVTPIAGSSATTQTFYITATPNQGGYTDGKTLTLDSTGAKGVVGETATAAAKEWGQ